MERVKGVEDLNIRIIDAQGIVGVGAFIHIFIAWFRTNVKIGWLIGPHPVI
jgi:hypothetical protein